MKLLTDSKKKAPSGALLTLSKFEFENISSECIEFSVSLTATNADNGLLNIHSKKREKMRIDDFMIFPACNKRDMNKINVMTTIGKT